MKDAVETLKAKIFNIERNIEFLNNVSVVGDEIASRDRIISGLEKSKSEHEKAIEILEKI